ncbi:hypothetical protein OIU84_004693 [Salix udensis]|uniref:Uncharacterized protein n=1 Tax=Salix udensis TaxID=889485 RepID=A0AAD6K2U9_9ROSI|nr:hypothetical protein OIU84_004693 [Salix udensis]
MGGLNEKVGFFKSGNTTLPVSSSTSIFQVSRNLTLPVSSSTSMIPLLSLHTPRPSLFLTHFPPHLSTPLPRFKSPPPQTHHPCFPISTLPAKTKTPSTGALPFGPNLDAVGVVLRDSERSCLIARLEGHNSIIASGAILNEIEQQLEYGAKKGDGLRFFPPADRQTQEMHFQTMMQDIAASLLMEFEKYVFQAEYSGTIHKTPLDSQASLSSEEVYF